MFLAPVDVDSMAIALVTLACCMTIFRRNRSCSCGQCGEITQSFFAQFKSDEWEKKDT